MTPLPEQEPSTSEPEDVAHSQLEAVLAHAPVMVFELDPLGRYTSCGGRPLGDIGLEPAAMLGRSIFEFSPTTPTSDPPPARARGRERPGSSPG